MFHSPLMRWLSVLVLVCLLALPRQTMAETLSGKNVDSRVLLGISAPAAGVQAFMPDGWTSVSFPGGPLAGANLLMAMIDSRIEMDAEGKPLAPPSRRAVALVGLGKQDDGDAVRMFVLRIYTTTPERDPYGVAMQAGIARTLSVTGPANGPRESDDFWRVVVEDGGKIRLDLKYTTSKRGWSDGELLPYSAANPNFYRIYRYNQLVDLVMSKAVGKPMNGEFKLVSTVLELADVFDGSEEVVAVLDVPVYVRDVYLP